MEMIVVSYPLILKLMAEIFGKLVIPSTWLFILLSPPFHSHSIYESNLFNACSINHFAIGHDQFHIRFQLIANTIVLNAIGKIEKSLEIDKL